MIDHAASMFQEPRSPGITAQASIPDRARLLLCLLGVADVGTFAWMLSAGDLLDRSSVLTAVVTLGGHHLVVLWLAVAGFVMLGLLAVLTGAMTAVRRFHVPFLVLGGMASVVALGGLLSVVLLTVGAVVLTALVGCALVSGRFVVLSGLFAEAELLPAAAAVRPPPRTGCPTSFAAAAALPITPFRPANLGEDVSSCPMKRVP